MSEQQRQRQRKMIYDVDASAGITEIAKELNVSHQRASAILNSAMAKFKRELEKRRGITKDNLLPD